MQLVAPVVQGFAMDADAPVACTLPPEGLPRRLAWIQSVTARGLIAHELGDASLRLRYRPEVAAELERIVEGERECCAFLRFDLQRRGDEAELTIHAPAGIGTDARWLFDQFLPRPGPAPAPVARRACGCAPGACR